MAGMRQEMRAAAMPGFAAQDETAPWGRPIRVADVPRGDTVFSYLRRRTGFDRAVRAARPRRARAAQLELELDGVDLAALRDAAVEILALEGFRGWRHAGGESRRYGGLSLTWNPDHQERPDPHAGTLGTPRNARDEFFWRAMQHHEEVRHSYFDTYGFRRRTPASRHGALGDFLDGFARPLIRSRIGVIPGAEVDPADPAYRELEGWHRDEPVFENLRVNVPLQTDPNFLFEMEAEAPRHLAVGRAYSWDTHRPHRVFCAGPTATTRIHLVIGLAPWFDYLPEEDAFRPNEFFGRVHPLDMLADGLVHRRLRLARGGAA
jgi:hypothetical protein